MWFLRMGYKKVYSFYLGFLECWILGCFFLEFRGYVKRNLSYIGRLYIVILVNRFS